MYHEVPISTDDSEAAEYVIDRALNLVEAYDARTHVLYVVGTSIYTSPDADADVVIDTLEREGDTTTRHVREAAEEAGIDVQTEVITETTHRPIQEYIDGHNIDLVVMGTHGRMGLSHYLLGSVTERVVHISPVPVLTVRLDDDEKSEADTADEATDVDADAEEQADSFEESKHSLGRRGR